MINAIKIGKKNWFNQVFSSFYFIAKKIIKKLSKNISNYFFTCDILKTIIGGQDVFYAWWYRKQYFKFLCYDDKSYYFGLALYHCTRFGSCACDILFD